MYCSNCGAKIDDNARFCPECGKSVAGEPAPQRELAPLRQPSSSQPRVPEYTPEPTSTRRKNTSFKKPQFKKEGSGEGSKVFFKILAAAIVVLVAYLGYDYFANGVGGGDEVVKKTSKPYFHLNEEEEGNADSFSSVAPSDLSLIGLKPTRQEVEAKEPLTAVVSAENPICKIGNISFEFEPYEFNEFDMPDTLQLRQLGSRHDEASGRNLILYDFSLKSGKHQFRSDVEITIPRSENGNGVLYYNEELKLWENAIYALSSDMQNYVLRTNHFSIFGTSESSVDKEHQEYDKTNPSYYYVANNKKSKLLTQAIGINYDKFKEYYKPSFVTCAQTSEYMTTEDKDELEDAIAVHAFMKGMGMLSEAYGYVNSGVDMLQLKKDIMPFSRFFTALGHALWAYNISNSLSKEDLTINNFFKKTEDKLDAPVTLSFLKDLFETKTKDGKYELGKVLAGLAPPIKIALAIWSLGGEKLLNLYLEHESFAPRNDFEFFYHRFMEKGIDMGEYGTLNIYGNGWENAVDKIIDNAASKSGYTKLVTKQIDDLYRDFVNRYFEISESERRRNENDYYENEHKPWIRSQRLVRPDFVRDNIKLFAPRVYKSIDNFSEDFIYISKQRATDEVLYNTEKAVSKSLKTMPDKLCDQLYKEHHDKILRYLNTMLVFRVKDKRLLDGSTFDKSPYNLRSGKKIRFEGTHAFKQIPLGTMPSDFSGALGIYADERNSDIIFTCRRYYYIQMGSPTRITFLGNGELEPIPIDFEVPKDIDKDQVFIDLVDAEGEKKAEAKKEKKENAGSKNTSNSNGSNSEAKKSFEIPSNFSASSVSGSHEEYGHKMNFSISGGYINPKEIVDDTSNDKIRHYDAYIKVGQTISVKAVNTQGYEDTGMEKWNSARCFMEVDGVGEGFMINEESGAKLPSASGSYVVQKGDRKIKASAHTGTEKWHPMGGVGVGIHVEVRYKVVE